jgi:hypothetical protein
MMITLWWIGLIVTLVVFVPLAVYLLHTAWRAARSIQLYARETLAAAAGVAANTKHIPALDATLSTAEQMVAAAGAVDKKLATIATVLAQRAGS